MKEPIKLWAYSEAPEEIRSQSPRYDDVDWLVLVPAGGELPWALNRLDSCEDPGYREQPDGSMLYAFCHA
jgi:hypothetical protein